MGLKTTHRIRTPLWQLCGFALLSAKVGVCLRRLQSNGAGYLQCTIQIVHVYSSYIFNLFKSVQVRLQKGCSLQTRRSTDGLVLRADSALQRPSTESNQHQSSRFSSSFGCQQGSGAGREVPLPVWSRTGSTIW